MFTNLRSNVKRQAILPSVHAVDRVAPCALSSGRVPAVIVTS
jgi:hypothetical protein